MAAFEVLALDPTTPQIRAPGAADTYSFPRAITPSGANVTPFTLSGYSLTGANAQSMFDLSGTWNTTGTPTALKLNITDTASNANSLLLDLQVGGSTRFNVRKDGTVNLSTNAPYINVPSGFAALQFSGANVLVWQSGAVRVNGAELQIGSTDTILTRDAANTLAQRNGTNAQTFNIYNTFTTVSDYERLMARWSSNVVSIGPDTGGTGSTTRTFSLGPAFFNGTNYTATADNPSLIRLTPQNIDFYTDGGINRANNYTPTSRLSISNSTGVTVATTFYVNNNTAQLNSTTVLSWASSSIYSAADTGLRRTAAGVVSASDGSTGVGYLRTPATTVASLLSAATAGAGARAFVTDATATTFLSTVAGGGANAVPVVSNGTNWLIG